MANYPNTDDHGTDAVQEARCVALAQDRRGHGQTTLGWYLARALVAAGLRVLVVDITWRRQRLDALAGSARLAHLGIWKPAPFRPAQLPAILQMARQQTRGRVDVILLDSEAALLESAGGFATPIDYMLALVDPTDAGQKAAEQLAERLGDTPPPRGRVGVVLSRVNISEAEHIPEQTADRRLPIIGYFPADYLLAGDDSSHRSGSSPAIPHEDYLQAVRRLSRKLILLAQLQRTTPQPQSDRSNDGHSEIV
ncbi:MAG TPA: hypothetical protein VFU63_02320 [Ktedonobacterales bacterium]|nr:hypothetical protein [Ktedonobacterales bacterium]